MPFFLWRGLIIFALLKSCLMKRILSLCISVFIASALFGGDGFTKGFKTASSKQAGLACDKREWSGWTNYWNSIYFKQMRSGNLFKVNVPDAEKMAESARLDLSTALGLTGMQIQPGFLKEVLQPDVQVLENPSAEELKAALKASDRVFLLAERGSALGDELAAKAPLSNAYSGTYIARDHKRLPLQAFVLTKGGKRLCAALGSERELELFKNLVQDTQSLVDKYDFKRGWFGARSDIMTVSCNPGTPIETMAAGMNEGNSWFIFNGEYERFAKEDLERWVGESGSGVVALTGTGYLIDCDNWDGYQEQLLKDNMYLIAKERDARGAHLFKAGDWGDFAGTPDSLYNGLYVQNGLEERFNKGTMPFVVPTGNIYDGGTASMVLFNPKGEPWDRAHLWSALDSRREIAVTSETAVVGDDAFRRPIQLMMIEQDYIETYFGDAVDITATVEGTTLSYTLTNNTGRKIKGDFSISLPPQVALGGSCPSRITIPAYGSISGQVDLALSPEVMGRRSAITVGYSWDESSKKVMAEMDMPLGVSTHKLLYGTTSGCKFPVSVYNFTNGKKVDVKVSVTSGSDVVYEAGRSLTLAKAAADTLCFDLQLPAGNYTVTAEAMGATAVTQLGIGEEAGDAVKLWKEDVNGDGIDEYYMENSQVRVMLLAIGARIMEYYVKECDDNVFFKNWPNQPDDADTRPYRRRNFWPFGGFEDFLGQASVETHEVYDCEVLHDGGEYAEVRMTADYFGNTIEKVFTLYGDTPLLGIRFALDMVNQEFNMLGPQPILEVGKAHDPQDRIIVPEAEGLSDYHVDMADYWGKFLFPIEGWNVDYDTAEDIYFAGAFPVDQPYTVHMWHNHPRNRDTRFYYCELQPWTPLLRGNTTYFSYYMWAGGGSWEEGIRELRDRNLITEKNQ